MGKESRLNSTPGILLAFGFAVIGVLMAGNGFNQYHGQSQNIDNAVNITATITETNIRTDSSGRGGIDYQAEISFDYRYEGEDYSSSYIYPLDNDKEFNSESEAEQYLHNYPQGREVTAHLNPENPGEAFLNAERSNQPFISMLIGVLMAVLGSFKALQRIL